LRGDPSYPSIQEGEGLEQAKLDPGDVINQMVWSNQVTELGSMRLSTTVPRMLVVGIGRGREDSQLTAIKEAAKRISLPVTQANTTEEANSAYRQKWHNLIILETRPSQNYDPDSVTKTIRQSTGGEYAIIVGVVRRNLLDKEELAVTTHLNAGMDRIVGESVSRAFWTNELVQLVRGPVNTAFRLRATQSLFSALDNCRDIVQITDSSHKVTWVNHTAETILGYSRDEILGRDIRELQTTGTGDNIASIADTQNPAERNCDPWFLNKLHDGKRWEGPINCKRKTGDYVPLASRVVPVSFSHNRSTDQIIYVKDPPPLLRDKIMSDSAALENITHQRIGSFRNTSFDVTSIISEVSANSSNYLRRPSTNKTYSMSVEAPINKVINIILAAQENQPSYIAQALNKVVDILKTSGSPDLFSPELEYERKKHGRDPDPGLDLLGALLANSGGRGGTMLPRRPSSDKGVVTGVIPTPCPSLPTIEAAPAQIRQLLSECNTWNFNIIQLERLTEKRPLVWLGMTTLLRFEVTKLLGIEESTLQNWLTLIEANYHSANSYHNSSHAADVMQATAYFLEKDNVKSLLDNVDEAICLIGAIIHDVDHPGRNSAYLCNSGSDLAILYNDTTVLENHHTALGFKLTQSDKRVNIFQNLDSDTYKVFRQGLIDVVLATDMSKHFVHVNKFCAHFCKSQDEDRMPELSTEGAAEGQTIMKRMLIKCADVSNPARPLDYCREWAARIAEEYFAQTDDEKAKGLPVVMPQFDRATCSIPKSQIGFYDFFIHDMFEAWNAFADCHELSANISTNYKFWKQQLEEEEKREVLAVGLTTLAKVDSVDSRSDSDTLTMHDNQSVASEQDKDL
jgi:high affinity cAMP-specific and IBMX-insensitive 3',5'-cyclic phosphodiesterase 8